MKYILENEKKELSEDFEKFFLDQAGAVTCRDIKSLRRLSCVGCIEKSAEFLASLG